MLADVLDGLGYNQSPHFVATDDGDTVDPVLRPLFRSARRAKVSGIYLFRTSDRSRGLTDRPAVYVAEASTAETAREIHRSLWNLGQAPFIIVVLPDHVRVYTGFNYSQQSEGEGLIEPSLPIVGELLRERLAGLDASSIDNGRVWESMPALPDHTRRVDVRLLASLTTLSRTLINGGLEPTVAHALIGKYVYIRYLRDRDILSDEWLADHGINIDLVLSRSATVVGLRTLVEALEDRFNGGVFPIDFNVDTAPSDENVALVASVFKGDELVSPAMLQLSLDFEAYDFRYIPIELLSAIYERFLKDEGVGHQVGAFYTPEPVADYLISRMAAAKPLRTGSKILDPSCGSGIFLVLTYRRLIETELSKRPDKALRHEELVRLLDGLYGVEREQDACYVAEFSLLLTLLDYVHPPALHANRQFRFPALHNSHIFQCDFFDDNSLFWTKGLEFDWIIGNPPWIELDEAGNSQRFARAWIDDNREDRPVSGQRLSEAFSWRVSDLLRSSGYVGLLLHATSLFNHEAARYRRAFFKQYEVIEITNFANLRREFFAGRAIAPAAIIIYGRSHDRREKTDIVHYGPFAVNQVVRSSGRLWTLTMNESEIRSIAAQDAEKGEATTWKTALWGTRRDTRVREQLDELLPITLNDLCKERNWLRPAEGAQLRNASTRSREQLEILSFLEGQYRLDTEKLNRSKYRFAVPVDALEEITPEISNIRKRGGKAGLLVAHPPHLVFGASGQYAVYSDKYFLIPPRQIGLSCCRQGAGIRPGEAEYSLEDSEYLRALSVFLSSSIVQYYLFFQVPSWGVERPVITLRDVRQVPLPQLSQDQVSQLASVQAMLAALPPPHNSRQLQAEIDQRVFQILNVPEGISTVVTDFVQARRPLIGSGQKIRDLLSPPDEATLLVYAEQLASELNEFTRSSRAHHAVTVTSTNQLIVCSVQIVDTGLPAAVRIQSAVSGDNRAVGDLDAVLRHQISQWVYIRRGLRVFDGDRIHIVKAPRVIDWTRTQALNDADDIIADIVSR